MIALAADHAGYPLKEVIKEYLMKQGIEVRDYGTNSLEPVDYPDFAKKAVEGIQSGECDKGIICCGTGVGISIAANKGKGIRCVSCSDCYSAKLSREHNDTNMLALGSRVVGNELALLIVENWLQGVFQKGIHEARIAKITQMEE